MSLGVDAGAGRDRPADEVSGLRALAHPIRLRILSLLTGAAMTAAEVARELDLTHANASYHLRQLHAAGAIEIVGEERIRGGVAKRYRYETGRKSAGHAENQRDHRLLYAAVAAELRRRSDHVRTDRRKHMTDAELWVDPETWADIRDRVNAASTDLHRAARPPRTPGTIRVSATIALFEMTTAAGIGGGDGVGA
jgi:DNA-binding transcriptional ArsR family regulator